jgi:hypothetical protein
VAFSLHQLLTSGFDFSRGGLCVPACSGTG